jgi:hypothetical protein
MNGCESDARSTTCFDASLLGDIDAITRDDAA